MKLSIVTTLYQSAPYVEEFYRRATDAARNVAGDDYEIIMVNDGSPDNSLEIAVKLVDSDPHLVVVDLSRNFGHHKAIMTGLQHAQGEYIFLIDSDLEEQPEWLFCFKEQMEQKECDVVFGVQEKRSGSSKISVILGSFFWRFLNTVSDLKFPRDPTTCRLMRRYYVDALLQYKDKIPYLAGMFIGAGFYQEPVFVKKQTRIHEDAPSYNFYKRLEQIYHSISFFSFKPMLFLFIFGFFIFISSLSISFFNIIFKIFYNEKLIPGFTSIFSAMMCLFGLNIIFTSVIGLYSARVFSEVKNQPFCIVKRIIKKNDV